MKHDNLTMAECEARYAEYVAPYLPAACHACGGHVRTPDDIGFFFPKVGAYDRSSEYGEYKIKYVVQITCFNCSMEKEPI